MKRVLLIVGAVLVVMVVAVWVLLLLVVDEDRVKSELQRIVAEQTRGELTIDGQLALHFFPRLSIEVAGLSYQLPEDEQPLAKLDSLQLGLAVMPLLSARVEVDDASLQGLKLALVRDKNGRGNWQRVMKSATLSSDGQAQSGDADPVNKDANVTEGEAKGEASGAFALQIANIDVAETAIHYRDLHAASEIQLDGFYLKASDVNLQGESFPVESGLALVLTEPALNTQLTVKSTLSVKDNNLIELDNTHLQFMADGEAVANKQVEVRVILDKVLADLAAETASVGRWQLRLNDIDMVGDLQASQWGSELQVDGRIEVKPFNLADTLTALGQTLPTMASKQALHKLALATTLSLRGEKIRLQPLKLELDESTMSGVLTLNNKRSGRIAANLTLDKFNLDHYLPPSEAGKAANESVPPAAAGGGQGVTAAKEEALFPLETLRGLDVDVSFALQKLIAHGLTLEDSKLKLTAYQGLLRLVSFDAKAYKGSIKADATLDVKGSTPKLALHKTVQGVTINPIAVILADTDWLYGALDFNLSLTSSGNSVTALEQRAKGSAGFRLRKGRAEGFNIEKTVCQGISLVNKESLKGEWPARTTLNDVVGKLRIDGMKLTNTELSGGLKNMQIKGKGVVDVAKETVDYGLGLKISGDQGADACRVNARYRDIYWPVRCAGKFSDEPSKLCGIDEKQMGKIIADMATHEVKRKAEEAIGDAIDKWFKR
ncbi:uncharacterized protein involved in outer membrane biogenesis [Sinobacterium caligoides]|uniref:Uncharacterized protein involved in outer membrane biogenesis n=2 Tax=Sinobacterium caligoides TaxID=933926 RepID=A0A3N2DGK9_9GAMM|nr:uncharacterized protein involved in outer membrane biogenesis [Sinobacterium caligoides]